MYTDEDLDFGVGKNIFSAESVKAFRSAISARKHAPSVDEENFRLISGFNDIFVVIACSLLIFSSQWVIYSLTDKFILGVAVSTILSWWLAEFFVRKRKMALPAILLLLAFVVGVFGFVLLLFPEPSGFSVVLAATISFMAAFAHWLRFKVPITIAVGLAAATGALISLFLTMIPEAKDWLLHLSFLCGIMTFISAMYWDASDTSRTTRNTDVAFWLHLLSAPLIIHPVFSSQGVLEGNENLISMGIVLVLYILLTIISPIIDRRAFMVSSLAYVLYALSSTIETYGGVGYSSAITGVFMGGALLLLSAYWHGVRGFIIGHLPARITVYIPKSSLK